MEYAAAVLSLGSAAFTGDVVGGKRGSGEDQGWRPAGLQCTVVHAEGATTQRNRAQTDIREATAKDGDRKGGGDKSSMRSATRVEE